MSARSLAALVAACFALGCIVGFPVGFTAALYYVESAARTAVARLWGRL